MAKKKLDVYREAINSLVDLRGRFLKSTTDMSDMKNWVCVHATNYMPRRNKDGQLYIPTTGMATGYKYSRATVHFTLNQIVSSHMGGNWDDQPVVVLVPYNDVVEKNGDPQMVATVDTFFVPNPDTGLILPESAHIVRPNNDTLFTIGDKISTYKTDHFTDEEIEMILSFFGPNERQMYEKYDNCDFTENELQNLLRNERVRKGYEKAKDKRAFLRGLFEETRMVMLTKFLREAVVRMTMEKMGYGYVTSHEDSTAGMVADAALAKGIKATSGKDGHSGTMERVFEQTGCLILDLIHMLETNNIEEIYEYCIGFRQPRYILLSDSLDTYQLYVDDWFRHQVKAIKEKVKMLKDLAEKNPESLYYQEEVSKTKELLELADKNEKGGIAAYNANLDIVLRRNAARLDQEYEKAMEKFKQNPEYPLLILMLNDFVNNGKKWHKTKGGWQPEPEPEETDLFEEERKHIYDVYFGFIKQLNLKTDIQSIYEYIIAYPEFTKVFYDILCNNKESDIYQLYANAFKDKINSIRQHIEYIQKLAKQFPNSEIIQKQAARSEEQLAYADKLEQGGIAAYDADLDITLRSSAELTNQFRAEWVEKFKQNPEYPLLIRMLSDLVKNGKKWYKTKDGWRPEEDSIFMNGIHERGL